ncbi:hypothetical protein ACUSIJ_23300 [Pseudochelatococcus sp. B33]
MNNDFADAMRRAGLSTRATILAEATRMIQNALAGRPAPHWRAPAEPEITPPPRRPPPFSIDADAEIVAPPAQSQAAPERLAAASPRLRRPLGEASRILREGRLAAGAFGAPDTPPPPFTRPR